MKQAYEYKEFRAGKLAIIESANAIIEQYLAQGYTLTLRQLYYQFIARDWFPESWIDITYNRRQGLPGDTKNTEKNYKRLGDIVTDGRNAGLIDWDAIVDNTRSLMSYNTWMSPRHRIRSALRTYAIDLWEDQPCRVEVWVEKDALSEIVSNACGEWQTPYFACRGYGSASAMREAGQRMMEYADMGQQPIVLHLGDHDPSGMDMTKDIRERLAKYAEQHVEVERIALNMSQIRQFNPPPNPAKVGDSRSAAYIRQFGDRSWELDALEPSYLESLISDSIYDLIDEILWDRRVAEMEGGRGLLQKVTERWEEVTEFLGD